MSIISANTLFHFTRRKEDLINILKTGFRPSFCEEFGDVVGNTLKKAALPMVCFCDLPISSLRNHIGLTGTIGGYGKYGLGMSKEWGVKNKINPVQYFTNESHVVAGASEATDKLYFILEHYEKQLTEMLRKNGGPLNHYNEEQKIIVATYDYSKKAFNASKLLSYYLKPYENINTKERYYDEREWRFVIPPNDNDKLSVDALSVGDAHYEQRKEKYKAVISQYYMLEFEAVDIKYVIVESSRDVDLLVSSLGMLPEKYSKDAVDRMIGRIITCDQIMEDF